MSGFFYCFVEVVVILDHACLLFEIISMFVKDSVAFMHVWTLGSSFVNSFLQKQSID